jgi:hypothetical protein
MDYEESIETEADAARAWAAMAAVTSYPRWTRSMTAVEPLDGPQLRVGHRFRIRQPGLPVTVWRVSEVDEGRSFSWRAEAPGVHTVAYHQVAPRPEGGARITIGIRQSGLLAGLVAALTAAKTRRYLALEAAGLKAAAEAATVGDGAP